MRRSEGRRAGIKVSTGCNGAQWDAAHFQSLRAHTVSAEHQHQNKNRAKINVSAETSGDKGEHRCDGVDRRWIQSEGPMG
jgi:hypothetical protein